MIPDQSGLLLENWNDQIAAVENGIGTMDHQKKMVLAKILESTNQHINQYEKFSKNGGFLNEATQTGDTSYLNKMFINVLTAAVPNIIAQDRLVA